MAGGQDSSMMSVEQQVKHEALLQAFHSSLVNFKRVVDF
jgi:hypothetical protein